MTLPKHTGIFCHHACVQEMKVTEWMKVLKQSSPLDEETAHQEEAVDIPAVILADDIEQRVVLDVKARVEKEVASPLVRKLVGITVEVVKGT